MSGQLDEDLKEMKLYINKPVLCGTGGLFGCRMTLCPEAGDTLQHML
jgi:hypothetical protein